MTTLDRISTLIEAGHESRINALADKLEATVILPDFLKAKLDKLGDTPIDEPSVYKAIESNDPITVALNALTEDEIKEFSATDIGAFIHAVTEKIRGYTLEDGTYKVTPNTEACRLPNFIEADKLRKSFVRQHEVLEKFKATPEVKAREKVAKEVTKVATEVNTLLMEISGLDKETLSDWEVGLVITMIAGTTNNAFLSSQGKPYAN